VKRAMGVMSSDTFQFHQETSELVFGKHPSLPPIVKCPGLILFPWPYTKEFKLVVYLQKHALQNPTEGHVIILEAHAFLWSLEIMPDQKNMFNNGWS
jgi:hypothetical protein